MIAALYVALTLLSTAFGLSSGIIQLRISEMLCVLALLTPAALPGLAVGCFIANLLSMCVPLDLVFGTLATLIGAALMRTFGRGRLRYISPLLYVASNTLIMPFVLKYAYHIEDGIFFLFATVGIGEIACAWIAGDLLLLALERTGLRSRLFLK